jgi:putative ABC transport system permease protein
MRGWVLAGMGRNPGPVIGTVVAAATAATLTVAAVSVGTSHSPAPLGRLAGADVVVAGDTLLHVTVGRGASADPQSATLPAYRGVPAGLARELARVQGVAKAAGKTAFPGGTTRPGTVDLIAVTADPGVSPGTLAHRSRDALHGGAGYTIATGAARGDVADPNLAIERANGQALGGAVIPFLLMVALFALAATTALSVNLRRRRFALLRAVGATRGQVRRAVLAEQAMLAVAGGLAGYLPGAALGAAGVRALVTHGMLPPGSTASPSPWLALLACAINLPVCVLSGLVAARRAARTSPAQAVREVNSERRRAHPVRVLLGLVAAAGVVALNVISLHQSGPAVQAALALPLLLAGMAACALLGPVLVTAVAAAAGPLRAAGPTARLALAAIRALPRRTASAVVPVAMAVGMIGAVAFSNTSIAHAADTQSAQAVTAGAVLTSSGPASSGLGPALLARAGALPGVRAAAGISSLQIAVTDPDLEYLGGAAISGGPLDRVLNLGVESGHLDRLRSGQIAVSAIEASSGVLGVHLGSRVTVYLPDGTPYTATVSAIYARSLALGDVLIPASVAAGHTGTAPGYGQILVDGARPAQLATLASAYPGVHVAGRQVYNAQVRQSYAQNSFGDLLILGVIAALAAVTMANTLAVATFERRHQVRLLARVGATRRQLAGMFGWQALFVTVVGIAAGVAVCAGALAAITRAVTGSPVPYIPAGPAALIVATVAAFATGTIMASLRAMSRSGA